MAKFTRGKKRASAAAAASDKKASKLAQSLSLSATEEAEMREAYELFPNSVRQAFTALGIAAPEDMLEDEDRMTWVRFLEVAALARRQEMGDEVEEVKEAFGLFTQGDEITLEDLRRIRGELREDIGEQQLQEMLLEANGGRQGRGVDM